MDFDDDMSGLQIEDLGEYFLQTEIGDSWKGFSLGYIEEEKSPTSASQSQQQSSSSTQAAQPSSSTASYLSSPSLAGFGALLKANTTDSAHPLHEAATKPPLEELSLSPAPIPLAQYDNKQPTSDGMMDFSAFRLDTSAPIQQQQPPPEQRHETTPKNVRITPTNATKRPFDMMEACSSDSCATIAPPPEDDRGFRKKSREKMRRQEVNVKFEELVDLLGLSNRVRKSAILQEAVTAIKSLKRERDEMRRDRDRLQQEVSKLATCLQYTHLGSVAAANAVAMSHGVPHLSHLNATNHALGHANPAAALSHPLHVSCAPGGACFPIGSTFGSTLLPANGTTGTTSAGASTASTLTSSTAMGTCPIAPRTDKLHRPHTPIAPLLAPASDQPPTVSTWSK